MSVNSQYKGNMINNSTGGGTANLSASMTPYMKSVLKHGFIGDDHGLSATGNSVRAQTSIAIDKARKQIKGLRGDTTRSIREKAALAKKGRDAVTSTLTNQMNIALSDIRARNEHASKLVNKALTSDWDQATAAIFAIEISKNSDTDKMMLALNDKNLLAALSMAPEAITGMKPKQVEFARQSYIDNNHPEIVEHNQITERNTLMYKNLSKINDGLQASYSVFTNDVRLNDGGDSEFSEY